VRRIEKHLRRRGMIDASAEAHPSADPEDNLAASAVLGNRRRPQAPSGWRGHLPLVPAALGYGQLLDEADIGIQSIASANSRLLSLVPLEPAT
jgi:hypothetical protein